MRCGRTSHGSTVSDGSMARWKFDGNVNDVSGEGSHGTFGSTPSFVGGKFIEAIQFDGDDYVEVVSAEGLSSFGISLWIKTQESGSSNSYWQNPIIIGKASGNYNSGDLDISSKNGMISFWSGIGGENDGRHFDGSTEVSDNQWHHIASTSDGSTMTL